MGDTGDKTGGRGGMKKLPGSNEKSARQE